MDESGEKKSIGKNIERFKDKLKIKELQLNILLNITNSINHNVSTEEVLGKFKHFVEEELKIEKFVLFSKFAGWHCLFDFGLDEGELASIDVKRDLLRHKEITSVNSIQNHALKNFDMVVPVYHGDKPLAYLILGDLKNEEHTVSNIIKHLNFLQLLTNIVISALENQRLAKELLKQEQERRKLTEKQNEILEKLVLERTKELRNEKEESERLLHNILPKDIADELKLKGSTTPLRYNEASILFTDFTGFTSASAKISAQELVSELNDIFMAFDFIIEKHGLEKIKTIGDSYMAACGLPKESSTHAIHCVRAAFDMIEFLEQRKQYAEIKWEMRAGINSGPLVAGVVGTKKFTYDIWGDTVNTASRMESGSEAGKINISETTYNLIKDYFNCEYRGKHTAKGKGEIDMYFVVREKETDRYSGLKKFIVKKLKKELPKNLLYHGIHHTLDVCDTVVTIALKENIDISNIELIKVAALFHDTGFLKQYTNNEEIACEFAKVYLPDFYFTPSEIKTICGMIMATRVPQNPKTKSEEIICDADLDYLGRSNYVPIAQTLYGELNANGILLNEKQWQQTQVKFLNHHHYFTKTSCELREDGKQKQIERIKNNLV